MTDFWAAEADTHTLEPVVAAARSFWDPTVEELFAHQQARNERLSRHRNSLRHESPADRARRQRHRAEQMAYELGSTRPNVVKAMLELVQADEAISPKGDPAPPAAPGARAVQKPAKPKTSSTARVALGEEARGPGDTGRSTVAKRNSSQPEQMGFWE